MAGASKSTKHADKIGSLDSFIAPWQTESGGETEIDKTALRRLLYNLKLGEAKALDARDDAVAEAETAQQERDEFKAQAESSNGEEANKKIAKLEKDLEAAVAERDELVAANTERELRAKVLVGLPEKFAKRVTGKTEEELKASLKELAEDFDLPLNKDGLYDEKAGNEDDDEDERVVRRQPRRDLRNLGDPEPDAPAEVDYDKVAAELITPQVL